MKIKTNLQKQWEQFKDLEFYPDRLCACGCDKLIPVKEMHQYDGIPVYIRGHNVRIEHPMNGFEAKIKVSEFQRFHNSMKNPEVAKLVSIAKTGKKLSEKHILNIKIATIRRYQNPEEHLKCSIFFKKMHSNPEVKEKHRSSLKRVFNSSEMKVKQSIVAKKRWKNLEFQSKMFSSSKVEPNSYELKILHLIRTRNLNFQYTGNRSFWVTSKGKHINPDFVDTEKKKVAIEVFADFWKQLHYGSVKNYLTERKDLFEKIGWKVIFIHDEDINRDDWESHCLNLIRSI